MSRRKRSAEPTPEEPTPEEPEPTCAWRSPRGVLQCAHEATHTVTTTPEGSDPVDTPACTVHLGELVGRAAQAGLVWVCPAGVEGTQIGAAAPSDEGDETAEGPGETAEDVA